VGLRCRQFRDLSGGLSAGEYLLVLWWLCLWHRWWCQRLWGF